MKKWLKQKLRNWLLTEEKEKVVDSDAVMGYPSSSGRIASNNTLMSNGMSFNVHKASGGFVIETSYYDYKNDQRNNRLYVVANEESLGNEISKIITMECMRM